jgi:hypothetical protein
MPVSVMAAGTARPWTSAAAPRVPLEVEDTVRLTRAVAVRAGYVGDLEVVQFEQGTTFAASSEVVSLLPEDSYERGGERNLPDLTASSIPHPGLFAGLPPARRYAASSASTWAGITAGRPSPS